MYGGNVIIRADYRNSVLVEFPDGDPGEHEKGLYKEQQFTVEWERSDKTREKLGTFVLSPLPGCCGVVVSTASYLEEKQRGLSYISTSFHEIKEKVARHYGYSLMLSTVQLRNLPEIIGASKAKWRFIHHFRNKRTDNDLTLGIKELK